MNKAKYIAWLLFSILVVPCWATIDIGIREHDPGSHPHEVIISYKANANFNSNPDNLWNSQFIIIRYPNTLPDAGSLVSNVVNTAGFSFSESHLGDDGTFKYMALNSAATNVLFNINNNETKDIFTIQFNSQSENATFELILSTDVLGPTLQTAVNNAVGGDVFSGLFDPASAMNVQLPVELLAFDCQPKENHILVNWESASETNFSGYELERSTDGSFFEKITWENGRGGSFAGYDYSFNDFSVEKNVRYYYRLKMIDIDGQFSYSPVCMTIIEKESGRPVIMPNPTNWNCIISFHKNRDEIVVLHLFDTMGRLIKVMDVMASRGSNSIEIDLYNLTAGLYYLQLSEKGMVSWRERVVKF